MEDGQYAAISDYLEHGTHPAVFTKSHKFVLRRSCKNYKLVKDKLYNKGTDSRGSDRNRQILILLLTDKVFSRVSPHCRGTKGRDATIGKVKERYYWSNFYKKSRRIKVHIANSSHFYLEYS